MQPGKPPRKRQRWRRRVFFGVLLLFALTACFLCVLILRPGWIFSEDWLRERIATTLREKANREVEIGHIELPRLGRVKLRDVVLKSRKGRLPMMQAKSFTLYVKILPLLRGQVVIKRLRFREPTFCISISDLAHMDVGGAAPGPEEIMARLAVEDLSIRNADVVILSEDGGPLFSVFRFNMSAQGAEGQPLDYTMDFRLEAEGLSGRVKAAGRLSAFRATGHALDIRGLEFESTSLRAVLAGKITSENQRPNFAMGVDAEGDLSALRKFLATLSIPIPKDLVIRGNSKMRLSFSGPLADLTIEGAVDVPKGAVTYKGRRLMRWEGKDDLTFTARAHKNEIALRTVKIKSSLGETIVTGKVQRSAQSPEIDLRVQTTADLAEIAKAAPKGFALTATGQLSSRLHVSGPTTDLKVTGTIDLSSVEVKNRGQVLKKSGEESKLAVDLAVRDEFLEVGEGTALTMPAGTIRAKGSIKSPLDTPILKVSISSEMAAAALWAMIPEEERKALSKWSPSGTAKADAKIEGTLSDFNLSGTVDLNTVVLNYDGKTLRTPDTPVETHFDVRLTESEATLNSITVSTDSASARVQGKILNVRTNPKADLEFDVRGDLDKLIPAARAHGLGLLPEGLSVTGPIRISGSAEEKGDGVFRIRSKLHIADVECRHGNVVVKPRHYEPDVGIDLSIAGDQIAVDRFRYHSDAFEVSGSGGVKDGNRLAMKMQSAIHLHPLQPLMKAELRHAISGIDTKNLSRETAELVKSLPDDLRASGVVSMTFRFSADLDDIEASGDVDIAGLRVDYRRIPLKKRPKRSGLAFNVQAERGNPVRAGLTLESNVGKTEVNGRIIAGKTPELDVLVESELHLGRCLAAIPIEEMHADDLLGKVLDQQRIDLRLLRRNLRASGTAESRFNIAGPLRSPRLSGGIDLGKVDWSVVSAKGKTLFHKPSGIHAKADFNVGLWDEEFVIHSIRLEHDDDVYAAEGDIVFSKGRLAAENVHLRANNEKAEAQLEVALSESDVRINRATVRHGKDVWDLSGRIEYTEDVIATDDFHFRLNDSKALIDLKATGYAEPSPEVSLVVLSPYFDIRPFAPRITLSPVRSAPLAERKNVNLALIPERRPKRLETFLRSAKLTGKIVIGNLLLDVDDRQDRNPAIRHYRLKNVSSHARLRDGVFALTVKGILNEGMVDFEWDADLNPNLPVNTLSYWADRIQAHDNLRPLLNYTFNNLYVEGELGFDGRASWQGLSGYNAARSMQGKTRMYINDGYLLGKAAPEYMLKIFPWLNLQQATWNFKRGEIISVTEGHICTNTMRFRYPGSTYLSGQSDNITKEIRYIFGVDLVDSFGLGESTGIIPDRIERKSSIDICRYVGTLDKQKVEWFKLRGDEIMSLLKKLLQTQSLATLFSPKKTPLEKAEHIEGRTVGIITAPARVGRSLVETPYRMRKRREVRKINRMRD